MDEKQREKVMAVYKGICQQRAKAKTNAEIEREYARWEGACQTMLAAGFSPVELETVWWNIKV